MTAEERAKKVRKYFAKFPGWAVWAVLIGIGGAYFHVGAIVAALLGGVVIYFHFQRLSDAEYDAIVADSQQHAGVKSLQKAGIDESEIVGEPVVITGPRLWSCGGADRLSKIGGDNTIRFTPIEVTVLQMAANQLIAYRACLDVVTGNFINEETDEYFYKDVVSIATKTQSKTFQTEDRGPLQLDAAETFILTTSGGTSIETVLNDPKLVEWFGGGKLPTTNAEKAIQTVRKMLREKKQDPVRA